MSENSKKAAGRASANLDMASTVFSTIGGFGFLAGPLSLGFTVGGGGAALITKGVSYALGELANDPPRFDFESADLGSRSKMVQAVAPWQSDGTPLGDALQDVITAGAASFLTLKRVLALMEWSQGAALVGDEALYKRFASEGKALLPEIESTLVALDGSISKAVSSLGVPVQPFGTGSGRLSDRSG